MKRVENHDPKGEDKPPERFQPKVMLIWLALILAMSGLWYMQSPSGDSDQITVKEVLDYAKDDQIDQAIIKFDSNGGAEWYVIQGKLVGAGAVSYTHLTLPTKA